MTGINKSAAYQVGSKIEKSQLAAQWNAVLVDDEWRLCDVFWASTCVVGKKSGEWALLAGDGEMEGEAEEDDNIQSSEGETMHTVNEFFFLTDPEQLICTHLPDAPKWQLLDEAYTPEKFENYVYIRERFFDMGVAMVEKSKRDCVIKTENGETQVVFGLTGNNSKSLQFRFLLYRAKDVSRASIAHFPLERYVFYHKGETSIEYNISFPVSGKFKMDLFGKNDDIHDNFDLVCSYMIECPLAATDVDALPDNPDIGWGPGAESEKVGLVAKSHEGGIINSHDGKIEIRFACKDDALNVLQNLKHNELNEFLLQRHAIARIEGEELVINMKLPQEGLYAFKLFADEPKPDAADLPNVCNYLIKVTEPGVKNDPYPELHGGILGKSYLADHLNVKSQRGEKLLKTQENKIKLDFKVPDDVELLCEITHKTMTTETLKKAVTKDVAGNIHTYTIELPEKGEYGINIYARYKDDICRIYHVYSCMADYESQVEEKCKAEEDPEVVMEETWKDETSVK